jgi:hypothetical protein
VSGKFGFDTFLTNLPEMSGSAASVPVSEPFARTSISSANSAAQPTPAPQPIDIVMAALKNGPITIRQMTPLVGNSLGTAIDTVDKLVTVGYVLRNGDEVELTPAGREAVLTLGK